MSKHHSILKATMLITAGTIIGKLLGFLRELVVAYQFGAGSITDAFVLTNSIPSLLFVTIASTITINYIPRMHRLAEDKKQNTFTSNLLGLLCMILLAGCGIICLFPKLFLLIFATGLPEQTKAYAIPMLRIVAFSIIPITFGQVFQCYAQVRNVFYSTALYGVAVNIIMILFTLLCSPAYYWLLSVGYISAHTLGMLMTLLSARKCGFRYIPVFKPKDEDIRSLLLLSLPLVVESITYSMSLLVDRNLASFLDEGTISGLGYAGTLGNVAETMITSAVITTTYPLLSKYAVQKKQESFIGVFEKYGLMICYLLAPISVFMMLFGEDIVSLLFERGAFDNTATRVVTECMVCYVAGLLPLGLQTYIIRAFYALEDVKTPVGIMVLSLCCNIVLNLLSVRYFGHIGIALSTSISNLIAYIILAVIARKKHSISCIRRLNCEGGLALLLSVLPAAAGLLLFHRLFPFPHLLLRLAAEGVLFLAGYCVLMLILRRSIFMNLFSIFKRSA